MPAAGTGLSVSTFNSSLLMNTRSCLSSCVRELVEMEPEAFLPHIGSLKEFIDKGRTSETLTHGEVNTLNQGQAC